VITKPGIMRTLEEHKVK